ncbi:MAG: AraC family transcriptional regulator [Clostridiales bacterium]|jgi:AraC-like DNA-binding protein|nr:AraC family transcriptional regulator [Clostridiales bacterium]
MAALTYIGKQARSYLIPLHRHTDWEIIYCTHGNGIIRFSDGQGFIYARGDILVIPPETPHSNSSDSGFKNIHVNLSDWVAPYKYFFKVADANNTVGQLLHQLILAYASEMKNKNAVIQNYVDLFLNLITGMVNIGYCSEYVETLKNKLIESFGDEDFDIGVYMRTLPLSAEYLRKLFIKETGISPLQFLTKIRLDNAKKLLAAMSTNRLQIKEIAHMSGFPDALYFSRLFKKHFGQNPSGYSEKS